ncbi:MAG: PEP-CTERM sorting domain-containing protein [Hyphomicrobiales bacterium]|nr:PEP-CTERM sorting domain-containing protein [Hyphomicrobiales bacterium]
MLPPLSKTIGPIPVAAESPEPATSAMMLLGFGSLFFAGDRKAKRGQTALSAANRQLPHDVRRDRRNAVFLCRRPPSISAPC